MSVYIKGFPLPNNCGACPLRLAWCRERIYMVTRPERCPLIPVPDHGRLIDADMAMLKIQEYIEEYGELDEHGWHNEKWCAMKEAAMSIDDAPTIIPADPAEEG